MTGLGNTKTSHIRLGINSCRAKAHCKQYMIEWISNLKWGYLVLACLTLGLAPFAPPHIWEKLQMLFKGELTRPIDWFDFIMHGTPWVFLIVKIIVNAFRPTV